MSAFTQSSVLSPQSYPLPRTVPNSHFGYHPQNRTRQRVILLDAHVIIDQVLIVDHNPSHPR